jgi:hypothetical protein
MGDGALESDEVVFWAFSAATGIGNPFLFPSSSVWKTPTSKSPVSNKVTIASAKRRERKTHTDIERSRFTKPIRIMMAIVKKKKKKKAVMLGIILPEAVQLVQQQQEQVDDDPPPLA